MADAEGFPLFHHDEQAITINALALSLKASSAQQIVVPTASSATAVRSIGLSARDTNASIPCGSRPWLAPSPHLAISDDPEVTISLVDPRRHIGAVEWMYIDDADQPQGPFPEQRMRQWLAAGYFTVETLVRCATEIPSIPGTGKYVPPAGHQAMAESGAITAGYGMFMPLGSLYADMRSAFDCRGSWVVQYT